MKWIILADFFPSKDCYWLDDFIEDNRFSFEKLPPPMASEDWHAAKGMTTGLAKWWRHFVHAWIALGRRPDGIITCFPQLAMCMGLLLRLRRRQVPVIAHNFNIGRLVPGLRQRIARASAAPISRFLVHSPQEVEAYATYLGVPEERIVFVPLQRPVPDIPRHEDSEAPFILAMGSAHRDYATLIDAVEDLDIRTVIVTREDIIDTLPKLDNVEFLHGLSQRDCLELLARARLSVTPLANMETASGQVTFVNAMQMGVTVIATRSPGTAGYVADGETGALVEAGDVDGLRQAIQHFWKDEAARNAMAERAKTFASEHLSDPAAAEALRRQLVVFLPESA